MRLINARKMYHQRYISFEEFYDDYKIPKYAILSHTWEQNQEVSYQNCNSVESRLKSGYHKIRTTCRLALEEQLEYVWIDTCCIDKTSSAELTEAINSMFKWYQQADSCYAYLSDFEYGGRLSACRWFTRGWTLQELIAPSDVWFFDKSWMSVGSRNVLKNQLESITGVPREILGHHAPLSSICVARRFSWAAKRTTTRIEDMAYCLLGIFDINIPLLYGEGPKAFYRLQEEILKSTFDLSIFAWSPPSLTPGNYCGFLAESVRYFYHCSTMCNTVDGVVEGGEITITSKGIRIQGTETLGPMANAAAGQYLLGLGCTMADGDEHHIGIPMRKVGPNIFLRTRSSSEDDARLFMVFNMDRGTNSATGTELYTLLAKLPDIPIPRPLTSCDGSEFVSCSRCTMVQFELPPEFAAVGREVGLQATPHEYWDAQDLAFFGTRSLDRNEGLLFLNPELRVVFHCLWSRSGPGWAFQGTLCSSDVADGQWFPLKGRVSRTNWQADPIGLVQESLNADFTLIRKSLNVNFQGREVSLSFNVRRIDDPRLCSGPRWKVTIELADRD